MRINKRFLIVYDFIFAYILKEYGLDAVIKFWKALAPVMLGDLLVKAKKDGLMGCKEYWDKVLTLEGAGYDMKFKDGALKLRITKCPSIDHLNIPACKEYCRHCGVMYPLILKQAGLKTEWVKSGNGRCEFTIKDPEED